MNSMNVMSKDVAGREEESSSEESEEVSERGGQQPGAVDGHIGGFLKDQAMKRKVVGLFKSKNSIDEKIIEDDSKSMRAKLSR